MRSKSLFGIGQLHVALRVRLQATLPLLQILALAAIQSAVTGCQSPDGSKSVESTIAAEPIGPGVSVESPAAACDELLGSVCPRDKVEPHICETVDEGTEKPDGQFKQMDSSECLTRKSLAAEICKSDAFPSAAYIRCRPVKLEKRAIDCVGVLQTMCTSNFAPARCVGVFERPKLPLVHFMVDGSNLCSAEVDLQKKICTLARAERKPKTKSNLVANWKTGCTKLETGDAIRQVP